MLEEFYSVLLIKSLATCLKQNLESELELIRLWCRDLAPTLLSTLQRWLTNEPMTDGLLHSRPANQATLFSIQKTTFKVRVVFNPNVNLIFHLCFVKDAYHFASNLMLLVSGVRAP